MKQSGSAWVNWAARAYYVIGTLYYVYHWLMFFGVSGVVVAIFLALSHKPLFAYVLSAGVANFSVIAIIGSISFWRRTVRIQLASLNPALKVQEMCVNYTYKSPTECDYVRKLKVRAMYSVNQYRAKFKWSSEGDISQETLGGAKSISISDHSIEVANLCSIEFERPLSKNETLEFAYRLKLDNAQKPVKRFLGHTMECAMNKLTFKVQLGVEIQANQFLKQIFINHVGDCPLKEEIVPITKMTRELEWNIKDPQYGYYYRITW